MGESCNKMIIKEKRRESSCVTSLKGESIIMNYTTCKESSLKYKNHFEQQIKSKTMRKNNHGFLMFAQMTHVVKAAL